MDDVVREDAIDRKIRLLREKNKELEKRHQMVQEDKRRAEAGGRAVNTRNPTTKPSKQFEKESSLLGNVKVKDYSRTCLLSLRKQSLSVGSVKLIDHEFCKYYLISQDSSSTAHTHQLHENERGEIVPPACDTISSDVFKAVCHRRLAEESGSSDNKSVCSENSKVSDKFKENESPCEEKLKRIRDFVEDLTTTRIAEFLKVMSTQNQQVLDFISGPVKDKRYGNAHMDSAHDEDAELNAYRERKLQNQRRNDERRNQRGRDSPGANSYHPQHGSGRYQSPQQMDSPQQNQPRRSGNYRSGGSSDGYSDSPRGRPHRDRGGQQRGAGSGGHVDKRAMRREEQRRSNIELMEEQMSGNIKEGDQSYQEPRGYLHDPSRNGTDEIPRGPPPRSVQYNPKDDRRRSNNRRSGPPSKAQMDVEMTGRQRQDYERWKKQADEADQYRMRKAQVKAREWDNEKVIDDEDDDRRGNRRYDEGRRLYDENQDDDDRGDRRRGGRRNDQYDGQRRRSDRGTPKQRIDGEVLCWKLDKERNRWIEVWVQKKQLNRKKERKISEGSSNSDEMSSIVSYASSDIVQEKEYHEEW